MHRCLFCKNLSQRDGISLVQEEGYGFLGESIAMNEQDVEDNLPVAFEAIMMCG